jgi:hypothetical protein
MYDRAEYERSVRRFWWLMAGWAFVVMLILL